MKTLIVPGRPCPVKFGRRRPARRHRLKLSDYTVSMHGLMSLPAPPPACNYAPSAAPCLSKLYMNDQLGDCVVAGGYHVVGVATGNAGDLFVATDDQILSDYSAIGGYVPGNESTDNGCDEQTALDYWRDTGFANGTKLLGAVAVDATNVQEIQQAMFLFENLFFGVELPDSWIRPFPSVSGFVWDVGSPDPDNGHCFVGVGYDDKGVQIDTWGLIGTITYAAMAALCAPDSGGQLYVMLTPDQLAKGETKAPNGIDWELLKADFAALGG